MTSATLADTSFFIAGERGDLMGPAQTALAVSVITIGELRQGVLAATDPAVTARRLSTLNVAEMLEPIPVDLAVADAWSELRMTLHTLHRRLEINDSWIAATAIAHQLPLMTKDRDFDDIPRLETIRC